MIIEFANRIAEILYKAKVRAVPALWEEILAYQKETKSTGAKYATLYHIYHSVLKRKPQGIVECGTGLSTVVICRAIEDLKVQNNSYSPSFISLESEEFYWTHAKNLLPKKYHDYVEIKLSALCEDAYGMFRGVRYEFMPTQHYDLVFVDGPNYKASDGRMSFCFDLINYIKNSQTPVYAVIDTRVSTVYVLQKLLGTSKVRYNPFSRVGFVYDAKSDDFRTITEPPSKNFCYSFLTGCLSLNLRRP